VNEAVTAVALPRATSRRSTRAATSVSTAAPFRRDRVAAVVAGGDLAVATSGASVRGDHVLDPHTRRPPSGVLSVTIAGPDLATAGAYATAGFAMGALAPEWDSIPPGGLRGDDDPRRRPRAADAGLPAPGAL